MNRPSLIRKSVSTNTVDMSRDWDDAGCGLYGESPRMKEVRRRLRRTAQTLFPVLILGESGTGKELVARGIHQHSSLRDKPFVPLDFSALACMLSEAPLVGSGRESLPRAHHIHQGFVASPQRETVFLDEIGEMPLDVQCKLLRFLKDDQFRPAGSAEPLQFDARIIAATNRELEVAIKKGTFRADLYFSLKVLSIALPPLRDRKEDIPLLVERILEGLSFVPPSAESDPPWTMSSEAIACLSEYHWPGNVRELEKCVTFAVVFASGPVIHSSDLPDWVQSPRSETSDDLAEQVISLKELECRAIRQALTRTNGNKMEAARLLGIGKTTLYRKLQKAPRK